MKRTNPSIALFASVLCVFLSSAQAETAFRGNGTAPTTDVKPSPSADACQEDFSNRCDVVLKGALTHEELRNELDLVNDRNGNGLREVCLNGATVTADPVHGEPEILVEDDSALRGVGCGTSTLRKETESTPLLRAGSRSVIEGLKIVSDTGASSLLVSLVEIRENEDVTLRDLDFTIHNRFAKAVFIHAGGSASAMHNINVEGYSSFGEVTGLSVLSGSSSAQIGSIKGLSCDFQNPWARCIDTDNVQIGEIDGVRVSGAGAFLSLSSTDVGVMKNVNLSTTGNAYISASYSHLNDVSDVQIQANTSVALSLGISSSISRLSRYTANAGISVGSGSWLGDMEQISINSNGTYAPILVSDGGLINVIERFLANTILVQEGGSIGLLSNGIVEEGIFGEEFIAFIVDVQY